jgi:hypothetical protein
MPALKEIRVRGVAHPLPIPPTWGKNKYDPPPSFPPLAQEPPFTPIYPG